MSLASIWIIGDWREPVFNEAVAGLRSRADCRCFASPAVACGGKKITSDGAFPRVIVLVQSRTGQFSAEQIEKLHASEPLARLVALTGPWCEGEQRSGRPIPGVTRIARRNWREVLPLELEINRDATRLPRTITETERIESVARYGNHLPRHPGLALICTARLTSYNFIADAARQLGLSPQLYDETNATATSGEAVIFDGWEQASLFNKRQASEDDQLRSIRILLMHFPRPEDQALAHSGGIHAVLPYPLSIADLNATLSERLNRVA